MNSKQPGASAGLFAATCRSELVVHADAHEPGTAAAIADCGIGSGREHTARRIVEGSGAPALAGIDVEAFDLGRPVVGEGVFDTAADGPAGVARRVAGQRVGVQAAIGQTAGDVDQGPVEGIADAGAHGAEIGAVTAASTGPPGVLAPRHATACIDILDIGLKAVDDRAGLPVIADLAATDEPAITTADTAQDAGRASSRPVDGDLARVSPAHAGVETDIKTSPGEQGRVDDRGRRRLAAGKVGGEGRRCQARRKNGGGYKT